MSALLRRQSEPNEAAPGQTSRESNAEEDARADRSDLDHFIRLLLTDDGTFAAEGALLQARGERGSWARVSEFVGDALAQLGRGWVAGKISIVQEHMASARLGRALGRLATSIRIHPRAPRALLVAAPGDDHTLGLALLELCLLEAGWRCRWAGRATPVDEVTAHLDTGEIQMVVASASQHSQDAAALARWVETVSGACQRNAATLVVGGRGAWPEHIPHGFRLRDFEQLSAYLAERMGKNGDERMGTEVKQ